MITLDPSFIGKLDPAVSKTITEDGVRTTTAAQSLLDARDRKKLPPSAMTAAGATKEFARMSRVEKLGVQGRLDLGEVRRGDGSDSEGDSSSDEDEDGDGDGTSVGGKESDESEDEDGQKKSKGM